MQKVVIYFKSAGMEQIMSEMEKMIKQRYHIDIITPFNNHLIVVYSKGENDGNIN